MVLAVSNTQVEILNLIHDIRSERDLNEIKSLLIAYFSDKVTSDADKSISDNGYPIEIFEKWKKEHFRNRA